METKDYRNGSAHNNSEAGTAIAAFAIGILAVFTCYVLFT